MAPSIAVVERGDRFSLGSSLFRGLRDTGARVSFINTEQWLGAWHPSLWRRVGRRLTSSWATRDLNRGLLSVIAEIRPDAVLIIKGYTIAPETVESIRRLTGCVAVVHPDDLQNPLSTSRFMIDSIPLWDAIFTARHFAIGELLAAGGKRVESLPFGHDPYLFYPSVDIDDNLRKCVTFVGTYAPDRLEILHLLSKRFNVRIWGSGWGRLRLSKGNTSTVSDRVVTGAELRTIISSSAAALNLLRPENRDLHNMRSFEIPGCGGLLVTQRTSDHQAIFRDREEALLFTDSAELEEQVENCLRDPLKGQRIANAGRSRLKIDGHTYETRARAVRHCIEEITNERST